MPATCVRSIVLLTRFESSEYLCRVEDTGGKMKIQKIAIYLDEQEILELESIMLDGDERAAFEFVKRLKKKIEILQRQQCGTKLVRGE
jgi:hypothetical protein